MLCSTEANTFGMTNTIKCGLMCRAKADNLSIERVVVVVVVVEASAPKVHSKVTLASASNLSGSVVRTLRG